MFICRHDNHRTFIRRTPSLRLKNFDSKKVSSSEEFVRIIQILCAKIIIYACNILEFQQGKQ